MSIISKFKNSLFIRGILSTFIKGFGALCNYALAYIIAKKLGPEGNGVFAYFMSILVISSSVLYFGLDIYIVKYVSFEKNLNKVKGLYKFLFHGFFKVLISLLTILALAIWLITKDLFYPILCFSVFFSVFVDLNASFLRGLKMTEFYSYFTQLAKNLMLLTLLLFFNLSTNNYDFLLILFLIGLIVNSIFVFNILLRAINPFTKEGTSEKYNFSFKNVLNETKAFWLSSIIIFSLVWIDFIFINFFLGSRESGIYSISLKLANFVTFSSMAFNIFLAPKISEEYGQKDGIDRLKKIITNNFLSVAPLIIFPYLVIVLFPSRLLDFFGSEFIEGKTALIILASAQLINGLLGPVSVILQMTGFQRQFQKILVYAFTVKIILSIVLIKIFDLTGIAVATFISISLWTVLGSYFIKMKLGVNSWFDTYFFIKAFKKLKG